MKYIERWTEARRQVAEWYREELSGLDGLLLPREKPHCRHVYHLFVVRHRRRDELMQFLANEQIYCGIHYPYPLSHAQPFEQALTAPGGLPVSTQLAKEILSLPMYPEMTRAHVRLVAEAIGRFASQKLVEA